MLQFQKRESKSTEFDSETDRLVMKTIAWVLWVLGLIGGGFIVMFWLVFGLAAAQGALTSSFVGRTVLAIAISLGGSLYAFSKKHFVIGVILNWAMMPIVFLLEDPIVILKLFR
jgi:hypothetical protein